MAAQAEEQRPAADTQWPRYEVFQQARPGQPHQNVGSVHAPDPELALLNARDIFGRRPETYTLWLVPAMAIYERTAVSLADDPLPPADALANANAGRTEAYAVFQKQTQRPSMVFVVYSGDVDASTPEHALALARERFGDGDSFVWWIVPRRAISSSSPDDVDSFFAPAHDKHYRSPSQYRTLTELREVKLKRRKRAGRGRRDGG